MAKAALHGLLHDVGKPLVRLCMRAVKRLEEYRGQTLSSIDSIVEGIASNAYESGELACKEDVDNFKKFVKELLESIVITDEEGRIVDCRSHDYLVKPILGEFGAEPVNTVKIADAHSAGERRDVDYEMIEMIPLKHYDTPLLSPFKLASYLGLKTHDSARLEVAHHQGPQVTLKSYEDRCEIGPGSSCYQSLKGKLGNFYSRDLKNLLGDKAWYPVKPLRWSKWAKEDYMAYNFDEARSKISYLEVVASLLSGLYHVASGFKAGRLNLLGAVESLLGVLRRSLLYVPSAVYRSKTRVVVPELSLYAHSRATAAIAQAILYPEGDEASPYKYKYRILVADLKGIQKYIQAQTSVSGAVRAFRGRSLIIELAQRAIARLILQRLKLTWPSILTYEGGKISVVIPCIEDKKLEELAEDIENYVKEEFIDLLGVTIAWTDCIQAEKKQSLYHLDIESPETLAGQLYKLNMEFQERRFRVKNFTGEIISPENLRTDPLLDRQVIAGLGYWIDVSEREREDLTRIAGDDAAEAILGEGGASLDVMRSLVAGTAAVNLSLIIEFYVGSREDAESLVNKVSGALGLRNYESLLAFGVIPLSGYRVKIGVIPLPRLKAVYILVSIDSPIKAEDLPRQSLAVAKAVLEQLSRSISGVKGVDKVVVTLVNLPEAFTCLLDEAGELASRLGASLSLDWIPLNTFYPVEEHEGSVVYKSLDETVASGILAAAIMDGDNMGNLMFFMATGTSRLATASELLSNTLGFHAVRLLSSYRPGNVYITYSGGDDAFMFGDLHGVVKWVIELADLYTSMLPGATISTSIAIGDVKEPLFLLFSDAKASLEPAKSTPLITVEGPDLGPLEWEGGIVNVSGAFKEVIIPVTGECKEPLRINGVPYRGPGSIDYAVRLSEGALRDTTRRSWARRMLQAVKPLIDYSTHAGMKPEAATALIQYSYLSERSRDETGESLLPMILREALEEKIIVNYPSGNIEYERVKLILAVKLASNPINLAIHLARTATYQGP